MNLATNLERSAFYFPDRPALSEGLSETSYSQLNERANQVATALIRMGVKPGDHVGLCAPNSVDWLTFYFGVLNGINIIEFQSNLRNFLAQLGRKEAGVNYER
jgi:long-chain acyl-CoA synthetase